jgi:hypothetical protein
MTAEQFIRTALRDGPARRWDILHSGQEAGYSVPQLCHAAEALGVRVTKSESGRHYDDRWSIAPKASRIRVTKDDAARSILVALLSFGDGELVHRTEVEGAMHLKPSQFDRGWRRLKMMAESFPTERGRPALIREQDGNRFRFGYTWTTDPDLIAVARLQEGKHAVTRVETMANLARVDEAELGDRAPLQVEATRRAARQVKQALRPVAVVA